MKLDSSSNGTYLSSATKQTEYYSRALVYLILAVTIIAGYYAKFFSHSTLIALIPCTLLYPYVVKLINERLNEWSWPQKQGFWLLDAVLLGASCAWIGFPFVPCALITLLFGISVLYYRNVRLLSLCAPLFVISAALTWSLLHPVINLQAPVLVDSAVFLVAALFAGTLIQHNRIHRRAVNRLRDELKRERTKALHLSHSMAKYLSPPVWQTVFAGKPGAKLETQRKKLTIFFSDIKGFTELAEELEAEALTEVLNSYLNDMSKIALKYGGTIDKFIGDSVMVFFGDPSTQGAKKDAQAAVSMALEMRKHMQVLRQRWRAQGIDKPLEIRMGINTGYCTVGNFGTEMRMDYTIIGREVNLASRLESAAAPNEILISTETYSLVKDTIMGRDKGQIQVKGFSRPVQIYQVVDFRRELGSNRSFVEHEMTGFSMYMDTNNIQSYDKERIIEALNNAAEQLRDKII